MDRPHPRPLSCQERGGRRNSGDVVLPMLSASVRRVQGTPARALHATDEDGQNDNRECRTDQHLVVGFGPASVQRRESLSLRPETSKRRRSDGTAIHVLFGRLRGTYENTNSSGPPFGHRCLEPRRDSALAAQCSFACELADTDRICWRARNARRPQTRREGLRGIPIQSSMSCSVAWAASTRGPPSI